MRISIEGEHDEIYRIIRGLITEDAEDSSRGIYECEVCITGGMIGSEDCHSTNTTILNVGRPPIIDIGIGTEPETPGPTMETYNIGSEICIEIDPLDPERNRPMQIVRLQCADVGDDDELNIPSALPTAVVSWEHTSLDGTKTAFFADNTYISDIEDFGYMPPPEFEMQFPLLLMTDVLSVSTNSPWATSALDFSTWNITRNASTLAYQALMEAFGTWTCTRNNSLGNDIATTFITDMSFCEARGSTAGTLAFTDTTPDTTFQRPFNDGQTVPCTVPLTLTSNVSPPGNTVKSVANSAIATYSVIATSTKVNYTSTPSPTVSTPSAFPMALIIIMSLVLIIAITTVLVVGSLVTWIIWKRHHYYKKNANKSTKHERTIGRELPELPSQPPHMNFVEQLKEELGRRNMLYLKHHLQLTKVIGEGESGLVYRGYITGNVCVAVKTAKALISENQKEKLLKEITLMMSFKHPNVMPLVGMCFDGEVPLLIMPLMSNGSVLDYIRNNEEVLYCTDMSSEEQMLAARKKCVDICHQIAKGMGYLAMKRFVHRDLAARNCMIDGFANGIIKVADFGMAEDMYGTNYYNYSSQGREERVPLKWMAPESIEKRIYSESSDVWSYGVTCWEVFTCGRTPYSGVPVMTLMSELHSGQRLDRPTNRACSDSIWSVIKGCWSLDSEKRPKFNDIVKETADLLDCDSAYFKL